MSTISDWLEDIDFEQDFIGPLIDGGWYQIVFPFLLVYAIVLTVLNQVKIFEDKKPIRVIISIIFALFSVAFPISDGDGCPSNYGSTLHSGCTLGDFMGALFPGVTAFSIGILALYIVAGMMGFDLMKFFGNNSQDNWIKYVLGALGILVVIYYYAKGFGWAGYEGSDLEEFLEDPLLYIIIVGGLVFYFISRDDGDEAAKKRLEKIDEGKAAERGN